MKKVLLTITTLCLGSVSNAALTKNQILEMSAKAVIAGGYAALVSGCEQVPNNEDLVSCVIRESGMPMYLYKAADNQLFTGKHLIGYLDASSDCYLSVEIEIEAEKANVLKNWSCY